MRCAIYTRKSADERAGTEFGSLENQRSYCSAYIASQGGQGWQELPDRYDDEGISGGTLRRPSLKRLRADIKAGKVDTVVVYKIDRLSRSLKDFCNLVAEFEEVGVNFVAVTQALDTATAMGRLTLNVLLSFGQFERELTSERLTDWFAGARERGLWVPQRPFGYAKLPGSNQLVPHETEAPQVRWMFQRYITIRSAERVADEMYLRGVRGAKGQPFTGGMVRRLIRHPIYLGKIVHRKQAMPGIHTPLVSAALWKKANEVLTDASLRRRSGRSRISPGLLKGLLYDRTGGILVYTFLWSKGHAYRYYIAQQESRRGYGKGSDPYMRFRAGDLEGAVLEVVHRMTGYDLSDLTKRETQERLRKYVERVDIDLEGMSVVFRAGGVVRAEAKGRLQPGAPRPRPTRYRPQLALDTVGELKPFPRPPAS